MNQIREMLLKQNTKPSYNKSNQVGPGRNTGALFEAVEFANGKIINSALSAYRVPRFSDIPKVEIILIDRKDLASAGAGEAAIIGIAPAIRNAIVDATGKALNSLPMLPNGMLA